MKFLKIASLTSDQLAAAVELDQLALGGLWTLDGYKRELDSPNSDLLVLENLGEEGLGAKGGGRGQEESEAQEQRLETEDWNSQPTSPEPSTLPLLGIACLWAILEEAHITILAVHPDYQRQGLGQILLWALLQSAWKRGLEWATLEVRVSNRAAIALYQKFGFSEVGRRRRYYQDTGEDALILWHNGLQRPEFQQTLKIWQSQILDRLCQSGWSLPVTDESLYPTRKIP
ncbi:ribosomal protein S18-alanine N-acetyltransferase [Oculatella sp. FACHB-28]|uniref:ribosomal protein S18-alanine N-acetyltransferase n=1 Tax=Oculatella sp. FACHB-28 TaxID=2692845 RepID=UPI0016868361|nr:ribosomal protein S18-alanine N-acetyltransferase [Oculatella sp. FACHB-28]MBD1869645.1 ribosomal protein S18-alanine N-acetyltransferase [Cyanobacteria bacterium FACHB-471]MBD2055913.1 ribosomal protein S18-alanine N-acetyltransferase [Oculatella sp. FACHB-28]